MKKNDQKTNDPKDKGDKPGSKEGKNAEKDYQPGEGKKPEDETTDDYTRREGDGFKAESKKKDTAEGAGSEGNNAEPDKYKGFLKKWQDAVRQRNKDAGKDAPKEGDKPK